MSTIQIEPIRKSIVVGCSPERAFEVFTGEIGDWWPLQTHSLTVAEDGSGRPRTAVLEPRQGGRIYEIAADGREADWGSVLVWEPPARLTFFWGVHRAEGATEVEVRFTPEGNGTRVELEHRHWERLGDRAEEVRGSYDGGWDTVLSCYQRILSS